MSAIALVQAITNTLVQRGNDVEALIENVIHEFLGANGM